MTPIPLRRVRAHYGSFADALLQRKVLDAGQLKDVTAEAEAAKAESVAQAQRLTDLEKQEKELELKRKAVAKRREIDNEEMLGKIELEQKNKDLTAMEAENAKIKADQEAYAVEGIVRAYNNLNVALVEAFAMTQMDPATIMARGFMSIGENAGKIGNFNITPDLLQTITQGIKAEAAK
jgi:hypothetical protein